MPQIDPLPGVGDELMSRCDGRPLDEEVGGKAVEVFASVSLHDFDMWLDRGDEKLDRWDYKALTPNTGRVIIHGMASGVHVIVHGRIIYGLRQQVARTAGNRAIDLTCHASVAVHYGNDDIDPLCLEMSLIRCGNARFRPDGGLKPLASQFPTFVMWMAVSEKWTHLMQKVRSCMATTPVQVAMGIKLSSNVKNVNPIAFPLKKLYAGVDIPAALVSHEDDRIALDTSWLQRLVWRINP
ncbi:hypothetical protein PI126_g15506 [Phytophthora idaei]|nr:hypothetical protein PI126_g15506 [Phytophthora idaei]